MLSILEYLCNSDSSRPVTKNHLMVNVSGIRQQRSDRVSHIMFTLEKNALIKSLKTSDSIYYQVTEKGIEAYSRWVKDYLDFVRFTNELNKSNR
jgi:predicted transcriptional regulator